MKKRCYYAEQEIWNVPGVPAPQAAAQTSASMFHLSCSCYYPLTPDQPAHAHRESGF